MNPCFCGYHGDPRRACTCAAGVNVAARNTRQLGRKRKVRSIEFVKGEFAGSSGIGSASSILPESRSRIPFPDSCTEPSTNPRWPLRRDASARPHSSAVNVRRVDESVETTEHHDRRGERESFLNTSAQETRLSHNWQEGRRLPLATDVAEAVEVMAAIRGDQLAASLTNSSLL
jgi:hypothetical protein